METGPKGISTHPHIHTLGGGHTTTKITTAYGNIVCALAEAGKRIGIAQQDIEDLLTVELGISQEDTMQKHVRLLVRLGYLKVAQRGLGKQGMRYDLVGAKVDAARRQLSMQESLPKDRRGVPRR